jgi:hypothetical protein
MWQEKTPRNESPDKSRFAHFSQKSEKWGTPLFWPVLRTNCLFNRLNDD